MRLGADQHAWVCRPAPLGSNPLVIDPKLMDLMSRLKSIDIKNSIIRITNIIIFIIIIINIIIIKNIIICIKNIIIFIIINIINKIINKFERNYYQY
jgi:hypothetical protein